MICERRKLAAVACALAAYSAAYVANITTGNVIVIADDAAIHADGSYDMDRVWVGEAYHFGGNLSYIAFAPANIADRMLRPAVWGRYDP
jgi:hypothetical protein